MSENYFQISENDQRKNPNLNVNQERFLQYNFFNFLNVIILHIRDLSVIDDNLPRTIENDVSTSVESNNNHVPPRKIYPFRSINQRRPFILTRHAKMLQKAKKDCICCRKENKENIPTRLKNCIKKGKPILRRKEFESNKPFLRSRKFTPRGFSYKCINCCRKMVLYDLIPMCVECIEDFSSQNVEIAVLNEEDAHEILEMKKRIGNSFQAELPEQIFDKKNFTKTINPWEGFKKNVQELFSPLRFSDEKLIYLLNLFQFEMEKCLTHMIKHRKGWLKLLKTFDFI